MTPLPTARDVDEVSNHVRLAPGTNIDAYLVKHDDRDTELSEAGRIRAAADYRALEQAGLIRGSGYNTREGFMKAWINALDAGFNLRQTVELRAEQEMERKAAVQREREVAAELERKQEDAVRAQVAVDDVADREAYLEHLAQVRMEQRRNQHVEVVPHTWTDFKAGRELARQRGLPPPDGSAQALVPGVIDVAAAGAAVSPMDGERRLGAGGEIEPG